MMHSSVISTTGATMRNSRRRIVAASHGARLSSLETSSLISFEIDVSTLTENAERLVLVVSGTGAPMALVMSADSSTSYRTGSFRLPGVVLVAMTLEGSIALVFPDDFSASLDLVKTLKVNVFQIGHGHMLHVRMVQSTSFAPKISRLFNHLFSNYLGRRSDVNRGRLRRYGLNDGQINGARVVNLLLAAAGPADNKKGDY